MLSPSLPLMPRLEIELTSRRDDGTWTWRAAGARQPKGTVRDELVPTGASTGEIVRAETEVDVDGITVVGITPIAPEDEGDHHTIEVIGSGRDEPAVITNVSSKPDQDRRRRKPRRGDRAPRGKGEPERGQTRERGDRTGPRDAPAGRRPRREGSPGDERSGRRSRPRGKQPASQRREPPPVPQRPKPKRLKPGRTHRNELISELSPEQQPIAEKLLAGGMAAVRAAIKEQNAAARREGRPEVPAGPVLTIAEELHPRLRTAEWLDRAQAAVADLEELSLRDLRSVVSAASDVARTTQGQQLAQSLREGLQARIERAHQQWIDDVRWALEAGRVVRALRLSSRPPERKHSLPDDVLERLRADASAALRSDAGPDRWAVVLEAVSFSPVRRDVVPAGPPSQPSTELLETVAKAAQRTPQVAALFGIDVTAPPGSPARAPSPPPPPPPAAPPPPPPPPKAEEEPAPQPAPQPSPSRDQPDDREGPRADRFGARPHDTPEEKVAEATLGPGDDEPRVSEDGGS